MSSLSGWVSDLFTLMMREIWEVAGACITLQDYWEVAVIVATNLLINCRPSTCLASRSARSTAIILLRKRAQTIFCPRIPFSFVRFYHYPVTASAVTSLRGYFHDSLDPSAALGIIILQVRIFLRFRLPRAAQMSAKSVGTTVDIIIQLG